MVAEDAVLVMGLKDEVSAGINRILVALEKYNTATKMSDKSTMSLEKSLARVQSQFSQSAAGINAQTASLTRAQAAAKAYQATIARIGSSTGTNSAGQAINNKGQFVGSATIEAQARAVAGLNAIEGEYVKTINAHNASQLANNNVMKAALPVGSERIAQLKAQAAAQAELARTSKLVNPASATTVGQKAAFITAAEAGAFGVVASESKGASAGLSEFTNHAIATRYALFSLSQTLFQVGTALVALPILSAFVASNFERDFANVERATLLPAKAANALKQSLLDLSETVPVSFKNITSIATAGAQLGIAPEGLVNFTRVVAELTATTNLSAEAAENFLGKFAKIAKVPSSQFVNLASAILNVGVHTAATESQIAKLGTQIVGIGREAGFTVPQIVGIAGALASVSSVGAELARGTVTRFVTDIQKAVNTGGPALDAFAKTAGVTGQAVQHAFGTSDFEPLFEKFIVGLDKIQESGGNANAVLAAIGVTSVRDVPLLLNLAAGNKVLAQAVSLANEGFANQDILAQHYAKINDTLVSKVKELGNTFAVLLNSVGSASTGPLKDVTVALTEFLKGFTGFAKTNSGQTFLIIAAAAAVLVGSLALAGSALAKIVGGALAAGTVYAEATKSVALFTAAQEAAAASSVSGVTKFGQLAAFLSNPYVLAVAAAVAALVILSDQLEKTKASAGEIQNALGTSQSFTKISGKIAQGGAGGNLFAGLAGADVAAKFKDFNNSVAKAAKLTGGNLWDQIVAGFGQGSLKEAQSMQLFEDRLKDTGQNLATLAQTDLPQAQNGFAVLAKSTDGSKKQLINLLNEMPAYKDELTRQLTIAGTAVNANNLLKIAYGGVGKGALDTAGKAKVLTDEIARQRDFQSNLSDVTGLAQKDIDAYGDSYQKSVQPLTDFNSIVSQVQDSLNKAAQAQAAATGKPASAYYDGVKVSLQQFTDQLNANNTAQATWFTNLITVATQYGNDAANIFIQAGYTAVNSSLLQQLVNATPAQAAAYIAAQTKAADDAAAATGAALISAGVLVTSSGEKIGKDTALKMGKELLAGFSPEAIMTQFNLQFAADPAVPVVNTKPAQNTIDAFRLIPYPPIEITVTADMSPFQRAVANARQQANAFATGAAGYASGGYTGDGGKFQPKGIVHGGEFVFTKEATSRIGVGKLYNLMRDSRNSRPVSHQYGYASGGAVPGFATLDASTMQAFLQMANRPIYLYTTDKMLASSVNNGNEAFAYGGQN